MVSGRRSSSFDREGTKRQSVKGGKSCEERGGGPKPNVKSSKKGRREGMVKRGEKTPSVNGSAKHLREGV